MAACMEEKYDIEVRVLKGHPLHKIERSGKNRKQKASLRGAFFWLFLIMPRSFLYGKKIYNYKICDIIFETIFVWMKERKNRCRLNA